MFPVKSVVKLLLCLGLFSAVTPLVALAQREKLPPADLEFVEKTWPNAKKTQTGIRYVVLQAGAGDTPKPGDKVNVLYEGRLLDGKVFDSAKDAAQPFTFRVRRDMVIEGWDQILQVMKKGDKLLVIIPPELAYGSRGQPPKIPRNSTLVFQIELIDFKRD